MQEHLQTLHESYRTEPYGPWHTRECDPWQYDVKIQECLNLANKTDSESRQWFLHQAKIFQDRANHLRHELVKQLDSPAQPITQQSSNSLAKKIRNQKTRLQYKKRRSLRVTVQIQEVDHIQEVEYSLGAWNKPGKHVVLQSVRWHTVVQSDWITMVAGITIEYGVTGIRRLGVG